MDPDYLVTSCSSMRDNTKGPTYLIGELGNTMEVGVAGDLDAYQDKFTQQEVRSKWPFLTQWISEERGDCCKSLFQL
jgi:hypothetical protein